VQSAVAPQYVLFVFGSTHVPPQSSSPLPHEVAQTPEPLQTSPPPHITPELAPWQFPLAPQCVLSVVGSMHAPSHDSSPGGQFASHVPASQLVPLLHVLSHAPQFSLSLCSFVHVPLQTSRPVWHDSAHTPAPLQTEPAPHWFPHAPQFALSVSTSTQADPQVIDGDAHAGARLLSPQAANRPHATSARTLLRKGI
jgi:hypothetical protein